MPDQDRQWTELCVCVERAEVILARSSGEVTTDALFDHETLRPAAGGLFCPTIFGCGGWGHLTLPVAVDHPMVRFQHPRPRDAQLFILPVLPVAARLPSEWPGLNERYLSAMWRIQEHAECPAASRHETAHRIQIAVDDLYGTPEDLGTDTLFARFNALTRPSEARVLCTAVIPDPELPPEACGLPWSVLRHLFEDCLHGQTEAQQRALITGRMTSLRAALSRHHGGRLGAPCLFRPTPTDDETVRLPIKAWSAMRMTSSDMVSIALEPIASGAWTGSLNVVEPLRPSALANLGQHILTTAVEGEKGEGLCFADSGEALAALEHGAVARCARIKVRGPRGDVVETTPGALLLAEDGARREALAFEAATRAGVSLGHWDLRPPAGKQRCLAEARRNLDEIRTLHQEALITDSEHYNKRVDAWSHAAEMVAHEVRSDSESTAAWNLLRDSGTLTYSQARLLRGMVGLIAKPGGEIFDLPVVTSLAEGVGPIDMFRLAMTKRSAWIQAASRADQGEQMTRDMLAAMGGVEISEADCGSHLGTHKPLWHDDEWVPNDTQALGRVSLHDVYDGDGALLVRADTLLGREDLEILREARCRSVKVRWALNCEAKRGVCARCYGADSRTGQLPDVGTPIGRLAAWSLGEESGGLTHRVFHICAGPELNSSRPFAPLYRTIDAPFDSTACFADVFVGESLWDDSDPLTGQRIKAVRTQGAAGLSPRVVLTCDAGDTIELPLPEGAQLAIDEGQRLRGGDLIARLPTLTHRRATGRTGAARLREILLHEVPCALAPLAAFDGVVHLDKRADGHTRLTLRNTSEPDAVYDLTRPACVRHGAWVQAGTALTWGVRSHHDLARIKGRAWMARHLLEEVQALFGTSATSFEQPFEVLVLCALGALRTSQPPSSGLDHHLRDAGLHLDAR